MKEDANTFSGIWENFHTTVETCPWLARRALEPSHQKIVDELWMEMLAALKALGFA